MRRGRLLEEIRVDMRDLRVEIRDLRDDTRAIRDDMRELREEVLEEQRFGRELLRRHELVMADLLKEMRELRAESRAHTRAIFALIDRLQGGGAAPAT